jgi:tetratricopeptide (TPR) repeat protein
MYATGTWEPGPQLGAGEPFDATTKLVVLAQTNGVYRLVELATGRELAQLEVPEQNTRQAVFAPDGTRLIVAGKNGLGIWDLRRIRNELAKLGLDWDAPPYPPVQDIETLPTLEVYVDLGPVPPTEELRSRNQSTRARKQAHQYICLSQWDKAAAEYAQADLLRQPLNDDAFAYACLFLIRDDIEGYHRFCRDLIQRAAETKGSSDNYVLARSCAIARNGLVDPARALEWATTALANGQGAWNFHVLGLAQYRAGQFDPALQSFTKANVKSWTSSNLNWFGLALVHHCLGHASDARQCFDKGMRWLEQEGPPRPDRPTRILPQDWLEAQLLRLEAKEVLGIN